MINADLQTKQEVGAIATWNAPYFIGLGRAMVSLGPISKNSYCPYRCRFCYVQGPFPKYASATVGEIVSWLTDRRDQYDIVYISGDTDSFAQPRTNEGLDLLDALQCLNVDVLFTTRYVFGQSDLERLMRLSSNYRARGLLLIGCISISQLHHPQLEPPPIESPYLRAQLLREMQRLGIVTALTIRPFIPTISASEYCEIAMLGGEFADVILGGDLYLDSEHAVEKGIRDAAEHLELDKSPPRLHALDFSLSDEEWMTLTHPEATAELRTICQTLGKPFFMRSAEAISWIRDRRSTFTEVPSLSTPV